ncbi:MAG: hypothetical protein JOZ67_07535 [Gammaproteobacteria bacterium]|nr:hypothetical protein [Gammaproteobacteria bacterium]MBV9697602.1 hypothetical protein [Gammaproteobacteria bacterium]
MAASARAPRERRTAIWPALVLPVVVLLAFYALHRMHHLKPVAPPAAPESAASAPGR